jgi:hypothetical protein
VWSILYKIHCSTERTLIVFGALLPFSAAQLECGLAYEPLLECHINRIAPKGTMVTVGINPHYVAFRERTP